MSSTFDNDELDYFTENIKATQPTAIASTTVDPVDEALPVADSKTKAKGSYKNLVNLVVIGLGTSVGAYLGYGLILNQSIDNLPDNASVNQLVVAEVIPDSGVNKATTLLDNTVAQASVYFSENNTFKGFKSGNSVKVASNAVSIVLIVTVDGACYSNGIATGYDSVTRLDPTGKRCLKKNFKSLQKLMSK